jgi:hypothetical protein
MAYGRGLTAVTWPLHSGSDAFHTFSAEGSVALALVEALRTSTTFPLGF